MEEIIYLTSLGSLDIYPENNASSFSNNLVGPLNLDANREYEVGILSLLCPQRVPVIHKGSINDGLQITATTPNGHVKTRHFVPKRNILTRDMESILKALNGEIVDWLIIFLNLADSITEILPKKRVLKWDGTNVLLTRQVVRPHRVPERLSKWTKEVVKEIHISFFPGLAKIIGFTPHVPYSIFAITNEILGPYINPSPPQPTNGVQYIYIYCDIVQPTPFGGKITNILDCFDFNTGFNKSGKNIIYRPLNVKFIPSISLALTDQKGSNIHFPRDSSVTAVLHIREKKKQG